MAGEPEAVCSQPTIPLGPVRVAVDNYYEVILTPHGPVGGFHGSPGMLAEAATGLLLREGLASPGDMAEPVRVERLAPHRYRLHIRLHRAAAATKPPIDGLDWGTVASAYRGFVARVSKKRCPYAVHTVAAYEASGEEPRLLYLVSDVSRHAAALKAAGLASSLLSTSPRAVRSPLIAVTTGRVSGDMVRAMAAAGFAAIVSNHHPVLSGVEEAHKRGLALVLRDPSGRGLALYTGRIRDAPQVRLPLGPSGGAEAYLGLPSPLC